MKSAIRKSNLNLFAHIPYIRRKGLLQGIVLHFYDAGHSPREYAAGAFEDAYFAKKHILHVVPYYDPYALMNRHTVEYINELVDTLLEARGLPKDLPIAVMGEGLGGQAALVYAIYCGRDICACMLNCPVCDLVDIVKKFPTFSRIAYMALKDVPGTLREALYTVSPVHLVPKFPLMRYHVVHAKTSRHLDSFIHYEHLVMGLRRKCMPATYALVNGSGHCRLPAIENAKLLSYTVDAVHKAFANQTADNVGNTEKGAASKEAGNTEEVKVPKKRGRKPKTLRNENA